MGFSIFVGFVALIMLCLACNMFWDDEFSAGLMCLIIGFVCMFLSVCSFYDDGKGYYENRIDNLKELSVEYEIEQTREKLNELLEDRHK